MNEWTTLPLFTSVTLLLLDRCDLQLDSEPTLLFSSQGPLSLLPSMDSSSVKAAMVSATRINKPINIKQMPDL